ncbi:clathrin interactor EPSIN 3 isoform X3 [Camellia sinensis]|uniref:clathrin interactor EPSIN 3 isoform X3 n=1 Tax=Camellia sinensis TaxID=4442 RepID=UPI00103610E5|nr:clathrin interactor EPSIN 3 isoform X3 [Camellia sinensis]
MKKAFDQTVRDIKREVNKKVLKVPGIEQKVLDATSNEPWGPHGSLLADIAQATRNYHEYQMIMSVIWKRINDTGKNWRHVYKALTVLEYLVAHGSERVIDEIREHVYQISTLSDFQYIDSGGRDQGSNVRKKSQSLVVLVNDKERIQEVRQKAAANRDKFRSTSMGGMYKPSSYSGSGGYGDRYDDDRNEGRYGSRDDDRNGYGREREGSYRDDDRYGRYGDSYGRDGDRYGRDSDERYSRDGYRDDDHQGRSRSIDDYQYSSRGRSSDRERDRAYDDDGQYSSNRGSGARADDHSQDGSYSGKRLDRKFSEQNLGAPPSYEEALGDARSPAHSERGGETSAASAPKTSASVGTSPSQATPAPATSAAPASASPVPVPAPARAPASAPAPPANKEVDGFDEFDPRGSFSAARTTSNGAEMDLLGSLSDSLAIVPVTTYAAATPEVNAPANFSSGPTFAATAASTVTNQPFEDPFGDGPFKALPSTGASPAQPQNIAPTSVNPNAQFSTQGFPASSQNADILEGILPTSGPSQTGFPAQVGQPASMMGFSAQAGPPTPQTSFPPSQPATHSGFQGQPSQPQPQTGFLGQASLPTSQAGFMTESGQPAPMTGFPGQTVHPATHYGFPGQTGQPQLQTSFSAQANQPASQPGFMTQSGQPAPMTSFQAQTGQLGQPTTFPAPSSQSAQPSANFYGNFNQQPRSAAPAAPHMASQATAGQTTQYNTGNFLPQTSPAVGPAAQHNNDVMGNFNPQVQPTTTITSQPGPLAIVAQPAKEKFEPKSTVWTDTLNRGLVNLNISGSKINPLADIGIDFDALNRKEKRMEKPTTATVTSTVTMGKAMGSGSGIGRAGAGAIRPPPNSMMGSGMGMGMGMGGAPGAAMGMGGYGGMNQMGMNRPMNVGMGMGMGMGMAQGPQMQPTGFPPGSTMPGGYNPMMGRGGYAPQQPYGGGYR